MHYDLTERVNGLEEKMRLAIKESLESTPEDKDIHPKVGVVIARDNEIIAKAHRNENREGSHAEYLAIKKAKDIGDFLDGAVLYTTLEPCTYRAKHVPCYEHIIKTGINTVVIGMFEPNKKICGKGVQALLHKKVSVIPNILYEDIRKINEEFIYKHGRGIRIKASARALIRNENRILMVRRADYPFKGKWCLPGGQVDYGETIEEAIEREVKEELDLDFWPEFAFQSEGLTNYRKNEKQSVFYFEGEFCGRMIIKRDEVSESRYFRRDEIQNLPVAFENKEGIMRFCRIYGIV